MGIRKPFPVLPSPYGSGQCNDSVAETRPCHIEVNCGSCFCTNRDAALKWLVFANPHLEIRRSIGDAIPMADVRAQWVEVISRRIFVRVKSDAPK
jgi:hypothetical protein